MSGCDEDGVSINEYESWGRLLRGQAESSAIIQASTRPSEPHKRSTSIRRLSSLPACVCSRAAMNPLSTWLASRSSGDDAARGTGSCESLVKPSLRLAIEKRRSTSAPLKPDDVEGLTPRLLSGSSSSVARAGVDQNEEKQRGKDRTAVFVTKTHRRRPSTPTRQRLLLRTLLS